MLVPWTGIVYCTLDRTKMPRSKTGVKRAPPDEEALEDAANSVNEGGLSVRAASERYKVSRTTLKRYITTSEQNNTYKSYKNCATRTVFSEKEESDLFTYLVTASRMHYGLPRRDLQILAYNFAQANNKTAPPSWEKNSRAGKQWYLDFMKRHKALSLRKPQATSLARGTSFNKHNVTMFFSKLNEVMEKYRFSAETIYNLDESGNTNVHVPGKIVACKGTKQVGSVTSGERGVNVTFIACINALGNSVPPLYVFPRVNFKEYMLKGAAPGSIGSAHPSGWSNGTIFLQYLEHFVKHVKCSPDNKILLILDNHESHITVEAIHFARENGVVMLTIPPHTSHKLQPLDRSVFGPYKTYYNTACTDWMHSHSGKPITIYDVAEISGTAYPLAFTPGNIQSGFRVSGIWPVNKHVFQEHEFMRSSVTDRPCPGTSDETATSQTDSSASTKTPQKTARPGPSLGEEPSTSASAFYTSPEVLRPFPMAAPRVSTTRGRKRGKCRILTDTPEKEEIEKSHEERLKKKLKLNKERVKKKVLVSSSSSSSSLEDKEDDIIIYDDDSDMDAEITSELEEETQESMDESPQSEEDFNGLMSSKMTVGAFFLAKLASKKKVHYYVAEITSVVPYLTVRYLKRLSNTNKFFYSNNQEFEIEKEDLLLLLPEPGHVGVSQRQKGMFTFDIDYKLYNVE